MLDHNLRTTLVKRCTDKIEEFECLGKTEQTAHGPLIHIDRGSNVLAVAHLDYVKFHKEPKFSRRRNTIYCGQLDDRLGVFVALDLLPLLGVNCDVLLTDSEEMGCSTAQFFDSPKEYNWIFQFDRAGTDLVMYDYDCKRNRDLVEKYGFEVGIGSFTDICWLEHLGVSGFNVGVGYYGQHTNKCHAILNETLTNARKFVNFWKDQKDIKNISPEKTTYYPRHGGAVKSYSGCDYYDSYYTKQSGDEYQDFDGGGPKYFDQVFCHHCGNFSSDENYYCDICGGTIVLCRQCGESIADDDWECNVCGHERDDISMQGFLERLERDTDYGYTDSGLYLPEDLTEEDDLVLP